MTYDQFEKKYIGWAVDFDGTAGVQCVDIVDQYFVDVIGISLAQMPWVAAARDMYNKFSSYPALVKYFDKIPNTRDLVVKKGDVVVWGGGTWGHVGIGTGKGNIDWFETLEENTLGKHEPTQKVTHKFASRVGVDCCGPVLGVLRPKKAVEEKTVTVTYTIKAKYKSQLDAYAKNFM